MKTVLDFIENDCRDYLKDAVIEGYTLENDFSLVSRWRIIKNGDRFNFTHDFGSLIDYLNK